MPAQDDNKRPDNRKNAELRRGKWSEFISVETTLDSRALGIVPVENDPDREDYILVREPAVLSCQACAYIVEKNFKKEKK
jgi:hypothetical protein